MPDEFRKFARDAIGTAKGVGEERRKTALRESAAHRQHEVELNQMNNQSAERQASLRADSSGGLRGNSSGIDTNLLSAILRSQGEQPNAFAAPPRLDQFMQDMRTAERDHFSASPHGSPTEIRGKQEELLGGMRKRHEENFGEKSPQVRGGIMGAVGRAGEALSHAFLPWSRPEMGRDEKIVHDKKLAAQEQAGAAKHMAELSKAGTPKYGGDINRYLTENFGEQFASQILSGAMPGAERAMAGNPMERALATYSQLTGQQPPNGGTPPHPHSNVATREHAPGTDPRSVFPDYDPDNFSRRGLEPGTGFLQTHGEDGAPGRLFSFGAPSQPQPAERYDTEAERLNAGRGLRDRVNTPAPPAPPAPAPPPNAPGARGPIDGVDDLHSDLGGRSVQPPAYSPSSDRRVSTDGLRNSDILNALRNPKEGSPAAKLYDSIASTGRKVVGASEDVHVAAREGARDIADRIKSTDITALASQKIGDSSFAEFISDMVRTAKSEGFSGADLHAVEKLESAIADGKELAKPVKDSAATAIEALLKQLEEAGKTSKAYANQSLR